MFLLNQLLVLSIDRSLLFATPPAGRVVIQKEQLSRTSDFSVIGNAAGDAKLTLVFGVVQRGGEEIDRMVRESAASGSPTYGHHPSVEEIHKTTANPEAVKQVKQWLTTSGVQIVKQTPHGHYLTTSSTVATFEALLDTDFKLVVQDQDGAQFIRAAKDLSVPQDMSEYIAVISGASALPTSRVRRTPGSRGIGVAAPDASGDGQVCGTYSTGLAASRVSSPSRLRAAYNIPEEAGSAEVRVAIYATGQKVLSLADMRQFHRKFLPEIPVDSFRVPKSVNDYVLIGELPEGFSPIQIEACSASQACSEVALDFQTASGLSPKTTFELWYQSSGDFGMLFATMLHDHGANLPDVLSISYGLDVLSISVSALAHWEVEAKNLAAAGVKIVVSSGDDGAHGQLERYLNPGQLEGKECDLSVSVPAIATHITAVGATLFAEQLYNKNSSPDLPDETAAACNSLGGNIFGHVCGDSAVSEVYNQPLHPGWSGGGFAGKFLAAQEGASQIFGYDFPQTPAWQLPAVKHFWDEMYQDSKGTSPFVSKFNANQVGRGYPDVALNGHLYPVYQHGKCGLELGTSASAPAFAAMVANANASGRVSGFMNDKLYANAERFKDMAGGDNTMGLHQKKQCSLHTDPLGGYPALPGWDPVTGLGSITQDTLAAILTIS